MALSIDDVTAFRGRIRSVDLGTVQLSEINVASRVVVRRTPRLIKRNAPDYLKVCLPVDGRCVVTQDGREATLAARDYVVYDTTRPFTAVFSGSRAVTVMFPRGLVRLSPSQLAQVTARRIGGRQSIGAPVSAFLIELCTRISEEDQVSNIYLADAVLDVLAASLAQRLSDDSPVDVASGRNGLLLLQIRAYIENRLMEPHLDVATVASAHHISVRQLQKLFEGECQTVSRWIRDRRLEHCRRDLTDAQFAGTPVGSIAARWGLVNAAYFSRRFRAAYGMTPTEYRAQAG